jgi:hypothetical protein
MQKIISYWDYVKIPVFLTKKMEFVAKSNGLFNVVVKTEDELASMDWQKYLNDRGAMTLRFSKEWKIPLDGDGKMYVIVFNCENDYIVLDYEMKEI